MRKLLTSIKWPGCDVLSPEILFIAYKTECVEVSNPLSKHNVRKAGKLNVGEIW